MLHLIDLNDWPLQDVTDILNLAKNIMQSPDDYMDVCRGKIMASLFYEPSTRTQMSFQAAMLRLGGQVIGFDNPVNSSISKGENLKDTIKIVSGYTDILVVRNPVEGSAKAASVFSNCPVINAGDGGHLHPTQTLLDLFTLLEEKGTLNGLKIGFCGDLKNGRTVHSLIKAMTRYQGNQFYLISTEALAIPYYIKEIIDNANCTYTEVRSLEEVIPELDILYMTRIQKERFSSEQEYNEQKKVYILDKCKMNKAKLGLKVLHPLPRVDEIAIEVDDDPRAVYFKQAVYGMYVRMALVMSMIRQEKIPDVSIDGEYRHVPCTNPYCITQQERYLPGLFEKNGDMLTCKYCDQRRLI